LIVPESGRSEAAFLDRPDGARLRVRRWPPSAAPRAVVQISHGMAEHSARYHRFAGALNHAGFAVIAHDHRGHGETARTAAVLGFFADRVGWRKVVDDLEAVRAVGRNAWPGVPVFLFGHSMGSFVAQDFIAGGDGLAGVILSGSNGTVPPLAGRLAARFERFRLGGRGRSTFLNARAFGAFNSRIPAPRTAFDWLSRDPAEVDAYIADPLCGFVPTAGLWVDLLEALTRLGSDEHKAGIPKDLPILCIAGRADPVSAGGRGLEPLMEGYRRAGIAKVESRLYDGARHELLNETNRDAVTADIIAWMIGRLA
jgi:alpha-beta hydrolase superfamily lysophospholipase